MKTPLVTILTPVYNQRDYVEETVESVLSQDYPNLEYIVIDDGSTDGTDELLEKYHGRVRVLRHQNMGQYATVNKAFPLAQGEVVGIVNSDDPLLPGAVQEIMAVFEANPDAIVVYPDWNMIDSSGATVMSYQTLDYSYSDMVRFQRCIPGPAAFFRRWVFEELKGRNPEYKFIADFDFWLRAGLLGRFVRLPKIVATFRVHPASITVSQRNAQMANEHLRLVDDYFHRKNIPAEIFRYRREAMASAHYIAGDILINNNYIRGCVHFLKSYFCIPIRYVLNSVLRKRLKDMLFIVVYKNKLIEPLLILKRKLFNSK